MEGYIPGVDSVDTMEELQKEKAMNSLTTEQIARVFAMYWDAQCIYTNASGYSEKRWVGMNMHQIKGYRAQKHYKLLLRPLSSISDEDAIEVARIADCFPYGWDRSGPNHEIRRSAEGEKVIVCKNARLAFGPRSIRLFIDDEFLATPNYWQIFQYLIQRVYAVPLFHGPNHPENGRTAIESGLALDSTKDVS